MTCKICNGPKVKFSTPCHYCGAMPLMVNGVLKHYNLSSMREIVSGLAGLAKAIEHKVNTSLRKIAA